MTLWKSVVYGHCQSKANSRRPTRSGLWIKSKKALEFEKVAVATMALFRPQMPFLGDLMVNMTIYYPSRRNDIDPSLVFDCLQKAGIIGNDRQLKEQHIYWGLDKENPRVEIELRSLT